jgi:hypothetical protein
MIPRQMNSVEVVMTAELVPRLVLVAPEHSAQPERDRRRGEKAAFS